MNARIATLGLLLIAVLVNESTGQPQHELNKKEAHMKEALELKTQSADRALYRDFMSQLNIFLGPKADFKARKGAAAHMLRLFSLFKTEQFSSLAITHLNRNGLTIKQLESFVQQKG